MTLHAEPPVPADAGPAPAESPSPDGVLGALREQPFDFDFFLAVRRIECGHPAAPRVGASEHAWEDPVRFCQEPSLAFATSTVRALRDRPNGASPRLFVSFMGLLGPNGPMPLHVTEYARDRERNHADPTLARFLDVFNHRAISLFYRAWALSRQAVSFDRPAQDRFAAYVGSLLGIGEDSFLTRDRVPDIAKLHYSGHLANHTRHADGLRAILEDYFRVPVQIQQMVGQWLDLPADSRCRVGASRGTGLLGSTIIVGSRFWDCQQKFRIRMGPMRFGDYERLLPSGSSLDRMVDWVRNYVCDEFTWDVRLVLLADEVPQITLGRVGRLGWTTWLRSGPLGHNADELVLRPAS